jgi:hypothetical protein
MTNAIVPAGQAGQIVTRNSFAPTNFDEALRFAEYISKTELIPKQYFNKPADIFVAVQYGMEVGLQPMQALQSIAVINGRPSMWGDAVLAVVMSHPAYEGHTEVLEGDGENRVGVFTIKRRGQEAHVSRFSVADAKKASLWGKTGPWTQYPDRMLKLRARGFALRDKFPDALRGIILAEEAQDYPQEPRNVTPAREPVRSAPVTETIRATTVKADFISREQAKEFGQAFKASGYLTVEAKNFLRGLGAQSTLQIPHDRFEEAMKWAQTKKTPSQHESAVRGAMSILGWDDKRLEAELAAVEGDWDRLYQQVEDAVERLAVVEESSAS